MNFPSAKSIQLLSAICIANLLGFSSNELHADGLNKDAFKGDFSYRNAERTEHFLFKDGHTLVGPIEPKRPLGSQQTMQIDTEHGASAFYCSNGKLNCVRTSRLVFAVPKNQLGLGARYTAAGTAFTLRRCIRGSGNVCQVALIKGDCQNIKDSETCETNRDGRSHSKNPGPILFFIYNEDIGVTSFGFSDSDLADEITIERLARTFIVDGDHGILNHRPRQKVPDSN